MQGGDIWDDFDHGSIVYVAEELGFYDDKHEMAPLNDPRWQNKIGKELLLFHLHTQLYNSL